ncbi:MAG TPA: hypothetical protein VI547_11615, partial [Anaerolineales bacterium]|nr:hypothetical protein [Anaerolineales bacterium]
HWLAREIDLALPLAKGFHDRWPKSVAILLCLVDGLFRTGEAHEAVDYLHTVAALDSGSEVVARYWGDSHPYRDLWPHAPAISLPGPIPAEVIALLGMNRIEQKATAGNGKTPDTDSEPEAARAAAPGHRHTGRSAAQAKDRLKTDRSPKSHRPVTGRSGPDVGRSQEASDSNFTKETVSELTPLEFGTLPETDETPLTAPAPVSEQLRDIHTTLNAIAAQIGTTRHQRKPAHVILFSPKLITAKFGPAAAEAVMTLIAELARVTARRRRVTVVILTPESPAPEFKLEPVDPAKAWDVKMMLHDLDRRLVQRGQAIGSLLIIGGDDLLPFHRLPNPTDDVDDDIPSDNPYGTTDDNYFIPEWPVGRLPSPCGRDPEPLCHLIRNTIAAHESTRITAGWVRGLLFRLLGRWIKELPPSSVGYAASIWKEAALEVFAPIGGAKELHTSPPLDSDKAPSISKTRLSYFNLHGIEDGPNWFGQRNEADGYGPLYPVALEPKHVSVPDLPKVIFTEACYGANILNKSEPDAALSLRFLADGACALIGSTKIAYGSVAPPLIGADLLGRQFWENSLGGLPVGEALRRAKVFVAYTMHKRQSFLDGEDQKTLISFVLYGDPLLPAVAVPGNARGQRKAIDLPAVKTVTMEYARADESEIQPELVSEIKSLLARYLPGAESARVTLSRPLSPVGAKSKSAPTHRVFTIAKTVRANAHTLPHFARVTVNKQGKVVKITVSR